MRPENPKHREENTLTRRLALPLLAASVALQAGVHLLMLTSEESEVRDA
jgi:hypothetical protein